MAAQRVLLTGFGPFPGVAENPSGWLAEALAQAPALDEEVHAHVLPTEWSTVAALTRRLHERLQPDVMIHFGVSSRADGLRIERSAHNLAARRLDACGALPIARAITADGPPRLDTRLPVPALAAHLRTQGHAAAASRSCGRYLCNFLYYHSLACAQRAGGDALFVHIPPPAARGAPFDAQELLDAATATLRFVLGVTAHRAPGVAAPPAEEARP